MATSQLVYSLAQDQDFQQVLNICSSSDYGGLDYMSAFFHRWIQEPDRLVFIARIHHRVVALESVLLVDSGETVLVQGLRVVPDLRGRGIAGALQKHVMAHVQQHYPEVRAVRMTRGEALSAKTLTKYRVIAKEAILSLCCEAIHLGPFVAELRSKLVREGQPPRTDLRTLSLQQAESLILSHHVVSTLLPGGTVIADWEPLKPLEANLKVLRRRRLTWMVDEEVEPAALGVLTEPYGVPLRYDALRININIFGHSLAAVRSVLLAQLEALLPGIRGYLVLYVYVDPNVWAGLNRFCQNQANVSFFKDYFEEYVLETDI